jgi:hypothetical protein
MCKVAVLLLMKLFDQIFSCCFSYTLGVQGSVYSVQSTFLNNSPSNPPWLFLVIFGYFLPRVKF